MMVSPLVPLSPEPYGDLAELTPEERGLIERMGQAQILLAEATDDFARLRIREEAKAVQAAATILNYSEVQITASHLVQRAERAIAFANEPVVTEMLNGQRHLAYPKNGESKIPVLPRNLIKMARVAHCHISDEEFESACSASVQEGTPLTRQFFIELSRMKRQSNPAWQTDPVVQPAEESGPAEIQERLQTAEERRQQAEAELSRERERANRLEREQERWRQYQGEKPGYGNTPEWRATFTGEDSLNKADALRQGQQAEIDRSRHLEQGTGNNERYTPDYIIQAVRQVIGDIDLDPASSDAANGIIQAKRYYTAERDGLAQDWTAESLWMNPPYSRGDIDAFVEKLAAEVQRGAVKRAMVITHNATETRWCRALLDNCAAFCLLKERVDFSTPGEQGGGTLRGQIVFLLGWSLRGAEGEPNWEYLDRFNEVFSDLGKVCIPYNIVEAGEG